MLERTSSTPLQDCFHASQAQLLQFFTRKTGSSEDARELVQELWLRLQGSEAAGARADLAQAYVFTAARNLLIDHLRRRTLADEHASAWLALHGDAAVGADTAQIIAQRRLLGEVGAALAALPRRTREVFVQHRVHGEDQEVLARQWGVTRSTIERDVMRANRSLDALLERWHAGAPVVAAAGMPAGEDSRPKRRRLLGSLLGLTALGGGSGWLWSWWRRHMPQWQGTLASAPGQRLTRMLDDGSRITLDADSRMAMAYFADRRTARLEQGAAFFEVAHMPDRPFSVEAGLVRVTVLGTRFAVDWQALPSARQTPEGAAHGVQGVVEVAVESGRVLVEPLLPDARWTAREVAAGERLRVWRREEDTAMQAPQLEPLQQAAPWRQGWLGFRDVPLGEVVGRLQRYAGVPIDVDPAAAQLPVTAEIRIANAGAWLQQLPTALPVRVVRQRGGGGLRIEHAVRSGS
ncbi:sigma-70 family RNA polymerase sigma factor [Corticibacter populi]|uniref:Sigma-70 family RNA polymerase sigma factor n=1 Tax=Corticibacter populi TaxID=1550736 RepID=A0A3M6QXV4_9BURK|nr:sigma-70 family RNA polymerase sigma factor [Corticibacter populi]RMX07847.1 sigma-70 family RNA polymerase sigma factor [Corticibacter populi]RZS35080.1 FecR family protein [Corticibacter populi]